MKFLKNKKGASLVEYGLIVSLIVVVSILSLKALGFGISEKIDCAGDSIENADDRCKGEDGAGAGDPSAGGEAGDPSSDDSFYS